MAKTTIATVKSFIRKNRAALLINVGSQFDGMTDCVQQTGQRGFSKALDSTLVYKYTQGVHGVWLVGNGRDHVYPFEREGLRGFDISNCCGSFSIAVAA